MKIAMSSKVYNKKGGISRYVAELAERFADEHEIHVFSSNWEDVGNDNIIFHKTPLPPGPLLVGAGTYFLEMSALSKLMRRKFDIIHTEGLESVWLDVVTAHSIHRAALEVMKNIGELNPLGTTDLFLLNVEKLNYQKYKNYRKIICVSNSSKQELMKYYKVPSEDIEVIPNGVNPDEFKPLNKLSLFPLRKKYDIGEGDAILLIVATEFYRKGMVELINAVDMLVNKRGHRDVKLLIVGKAQVEGQRKGDSYYRKLAQKLGVSKNVIFTGRVADLNAHYNLGDIFVFPTKYEAFGIQTLEAMSCGLPVINSKIGAGELITDGHDGIHFEDPNNVEEIADKIEMLLIDDKTRNNLGKNARKTAMKYSWDSIASRTMKIYEEILGD
ncbi:D-inositol-3-phosphate glycosyltransferase [uncultured archaeon]|nr:D-inositol-3-phosphate glycosyltransferase [uncultured archaeon]